MINFLINAVKSAVKLSFAWLFWLVFPSLQTGLAFVSGVLVVSLLLLTYNKVVAAQRKVEQAERRASPTFEPPSETEAEQRIAATPQQPEPGREERISDIPTMDAMPSDDIMELSESDDDVQEVQSRQAPVPEVQSRQTPVFESESRQSSVSESQSRQSSVPESQLRQAPARESLVVRPSEVDANVNVNQFDAPVAAEDLLDQYCMRMSDFQRGNFPDIAAAGGLELFLHHLHSTVGEVAAFWWGTQRVVSLMPSHWSRIQGTQFFSHPKLLYDGLRPLIGDQSVQTAIAADAKVRRAQYLTPSLGHVAIKSHLAQLFDVASSVTGAWTALCRANNKWAEIDVSDALEKWALRANVATTLGGLGEKQLETLRINLNEMCAMLERRMQAGELSNTQRDLAFKGSFDIVRGVLEMKIGGGKGMYTFDHRETMLSKLSTYAAAALCDCNDDERTEQIIDELVNAIVIGTYTTAYTMTWALFYLARDRGVLETTRSAVREALGEEAVPSEWKHINMLLSGYVGQVINEALRLSAVLPWTAHESESDVVLENGVVIPARTPIIVPVATAHLSPEYWINAREFNPTRFLARKDINVAFAPFGGAGGRTCPAESLAKVQLAVMLSSILQQFDVHLSHDQVTPERVFGLITRPSVPLHVTLKKRSAKFTSSFSSKS